MPEFTTQNQDPHPSTNLCFHASGRVWGSIHTNGSSVQEATAVGRHALSLYIDGLDGLGLGSKICHSVINQLTGVLSYMTGKRKPPWSH